MSAQKPDDGMIYYDARNRPAAKVGDWEVLDEGTDEAPRTIFLHKRSKLRFTVGCTSPSPSQWRFGAKCDNPPSPARRRIEPLGRQVMELWLKAMSTTAEIEVAECEAWEASLLGRIN